MQARPIPPRHVEGPNPPLGENAYRSRGLELKLEKIQHEVEKSPGQKGMDNASLCSDQPIQASCRFLIRLTSVGSSDGLS